MWWKEDSSGGDTQVQRGWKVVKEKNKIKRFKAGIKEQWYPEDAGVSNEGHLAEYAQWRIWDLGRHIIPRIYSTDTILCKDACIRTYVSALMVLILSIYKNMYGYIYRVEYYAVLKRMR